MAEAKVTTDHNKIQRWVEERGGWPARVKSTAKGRKSGILRIDFPGFTGQETLEKIAWEDFFNALEENNLAFLYQDESDSRFNKFIDRDSVDANEQKARSGKA